MINKLKKSKAGFTLVELIVVIAIIGVLAAVLAPQYIKYVEESREAVDENTVEEVRHSAEIALANESVYDALKSGTSLIITSDGSKTAANSIIKIDSDNKLDSAGTLTGNNALLKELQSTIKAPVFKSNTHKTGGTAPTYTITIAFNSTSKTYSVTGAWGA